MNNFQQILRGTPVTLCFLCKNTDEKLTLTSFNVSLFTLFLQKNYFYIINIMITIIISINIMFPLSQIIS